MPNIIANRELWEPIPSEEKARITVLLKRTGLLGNTDQILCDGNGAGEILRPTVPVSSLCHPSIAENLTTPPPVFIPIPEADRLLYKFDLQKWFYADEFARKADIECFGKMQEEITSMKVDFMASGQKLLAALELSARMGTIVQRLYSYGDLRFGVNTTNAACQREYKEGQTIENEYYSITGFIIAGIQDLNESELDRLVVQEPSLSTYTFLFKTWRQEKAHTSTEAVEGVLEILSPRLDPFRRSFYAMMQRHFPDSAITIDTQVFDVTKPGDYAQVLRLDDRKLREEGFRRRIVSYKSQADIFAFALYEKCQASNSVADIHNFPNAMDSAFFDAYLTPEMVDSMLEVFRKHSSLAIRFQKAERAYQQRLLDIESVEPWDVEVGSPNRPDPRFSIKEASEAVVNATKIFGVDYGAELTHLLDPRNGRLDLVAGPNRRAGDGTQGAYGPAWLIYMQGYGGYLTDVVTLAHESAHVVHYRLLNAAGVPFYYGDGPRYFTEAFAKLNELLLLKCLSASAKTEPERLFYFYQLNSKLCSVKFASMFWAAYATNFELELYRRVASGAVNQPEAIHDIWAEFGRIWVLDFDKYPDQKFTWSDTHHFFDSSRCYFNYVFAWIIAAALFEHIQTDPPFAGKVVELMRLGFSDEPSHLLKTKLGINLSDQDLIARVFDLVDANLTELETTIRKTSICGPSGGRKQ